MQKALFAAAIFAAEQLIKHAPELFADFRALVNKQSVTIDELRAERERVAALDYKALVPDSKLPDSTTSQPSLV